MFDTILGKMFDTNMKLKTLSVEIQHDSVLEMWAQLGLNQ